MFKFAANELSSVLHRGMNGLQQTAGTVNRSLDGHPLLKQALQYSAIAATILVAPEIGAALWAVKSYREMSQPSTAHIDLAKLEPATAEPAVVIASSDMHDQPAATRAASWWNTASGYASGILGSSRPEDNYFSDSVSDEPLFMTGGSMTVDSDELPVSSKASSPVADLLAEENKIPIPTSVINQSSDEVQSTDQIQYLPPLLSSRVDFGPRDDDSPISSDGSESPSPSDEFDLTEAHIDGLAQFGFIPVQNAERDDDITPRPPQEDDKAPVNVSVSDVSEDEVAQFIRSAIDEAPQTSSSPVLTDAQAHTFDSAIVMSSAESSRVSSPFTVSESGSVTSPKKIKEFSYGHTLADRLIAARDSDDPQVLAKLSQDTDYRVRLKAVKNEHFTDVTAIEDLLKNETDTEILTHLINRSASLSTSVVDHLLKQTGLHNTVYVALAKHESISAKHLFELAQNHSSGAIAVAIAQNKNAGQKTLEMLAKSKDIEVKKAIIVMAKFVSGSARAKYKLALTHIVNAGGSANELIKKSARELLKAK